MSYYLDTSLIAAYYCNDATSAYAQAALSQLSIAYISILTEVELHSAIAKKIRNHELTKTIGHQILQQFYQHHKAGFYKKVRILNKHYLEACNWLGFFNSNLRTYDALHLAIAHDNNKTLLTLDRGQATAAKILGISAKYLKGS